MAYQRIVAKHDYFLKHGTLLYITLCYVILIKKFAGLEGFAYTTGVVDTIYFITGENLYAVREALQRWDAEFSAKHGPENCLRLTADDCEFRSLIDEVSTMPFLGERRLVLVRGVPKFTKEQMEQCFRCIHPQTILAFFQATPDKRLSAVKYLLEHATVQDLPLLSEAKLSAWITREVTLLGCSIAPEAVAELLSAVGKDQDFLLTEVQRLCSQPGLAITGQIIRHSTIASAEHEVWKVSNLLLQRDPDILLQAVRQLMRQGEDPQSLWAMFAWTLRSITALSAAVWAGHQSLPDATKASGVAFPTARTFLPAVSTIRLEPLRDLVEWTSGVEIALKTGDIRSGSDDQSELLATYQEGLLRLQALLQKH